MVSTKQEAAWVLKPFYIFEKRNMSCFYHISNPLHFSLWLGQCSLLTKCGLHRAIQLPWGPIMKHTQLQHNTIQFIFQWIFVYMCNRMILQIHRHSAENSKDTFEYFNIKGNYNYLKWNCNKLGIRICTSIPCELTKNEPPNLIRAISYSRLHNLSCVKLIKPSHKQIKM
jgi:hypothetical protein